MSAVSEIVTFLRARLDEDEAAAKAVRPGDWDDCDAWAEFGDDACVHFRRHDPARVLREIEAGRGRLALMLEATAEMDRLLADNTAATADVAMALGRARAATVAVKHDAAIHAAHPDYMPEWKPW